MSNLFPPPSSKIEDDDDPGYFFSLLSSMNQQLSDQYMENDVTKEINDGMHVIGEDDLLINKVIEENDFLKPVHANNHMPVLPFESGEGLPYAPVDWPSPGDIWTWRVGRRYQLSSGYFQDRFLYPPKRLQTLGRGKLCFGSKTSVEKYICSEFPGVDVDAFFASFVWRIRAKIPSPTIEAAPFNLEVPPPHEAVEVKEEQEEFYNSGRKKRKAATTPLKQDAVSLQSNQVAEASPPASKRKTKMLKQNGALSRFKKNEVASSSASARKSRRSNANNEGHVKLPEQNMINVIPEDFDNYLNSLEDILSQPLSEPPASYYETTESPAAEYEMADTRRKLSSLLVMDFPSLVLSKNISELVSLSKKLQKDPCLSAEQLVKLKLIEEIPSFSEVFRESRKMIDQVNKNFASLEANKATVISLKNEYNELKEKADQLQSNIDSNFSAVQEIDKQIEQLQSWRVELTNKMEGNKVAKLEVTGTQTVVANEIPTVVVEIQRSNAKMPEWELKKANAEKREAEILAKFTPLEGFSL